MKGRLSVGCAVILLLMAWQLAAEQSAEFMMLLASPEGVGAAFARELSSEAFHAAIYHSLIHVGVGVTIGGAFGTLAGIADAESLPGATFVRALDLLLRPIPPLACIPFAIILFGTSDLTAIFIVAVGVFWTTLIATREALRAVPREYHELATAYGFHTRARRLRCITRPAAMPGIFAGVKSAVGQGWTLVVAAELVGIPGIGQRLWEAASLLANETVFAYMATIALLNRGSDGILGAIDRRIFAWRR